MSLWDYFVAIVDKHFKYLESDFKFTKVSTEIPFIVYESPLMHVNVFWQCGGRYQLDLDIEISKTIYDRGQSIGIGLLAQIHSPKGHERYEWLLMNTKEKLEIGVQEISGLLLEYGSDLLRGELHDIVILEKMEKEVAEMLGSHHSGKSYVQIVEEVTKKYEREHLKEHSKAHQRIDENKS